MDLTPYLNFNGTCAAAFKLYEQVFGGKITMIQTFGESPMKDQAPPDWQDKVMHVRMEIGNHVLMGSDAPPGRYEKPQGIQVAIGLKDPVEGEKVFKAISEGGTVVMEYQKTYWAGGFGMCVDRFGIPWMVNCD
jgi:PhnB protein